MAIRLATASCFVRVQPSLASCRRFCCFRWYRFQVVTFVVVVVDVVLGQAFMEFIRQQILQHLRPYYVYVGTFWFWYFGCRSRASPHTCPKSFLYYRTISTFINLFNQLDTYTPSGLTNGSVSSCGRVTIEHILPLFLDL